MDLYDELAADGVQFEMKRDGLLLLYRDENALNDEISLLDRLDYGPLERLGKEEIREAEPAVVAEFAGAIRVRPERHVRPETLCAGLAAWLRSHGADLREGFAVRNVRCERGRVQDVEGSTGSVTADHFLIATGAEAATLAAACGSSLPMQAGKGYSITVTEPRVQIRGPLYCADAKVAVTPYDGALRVSGTMELSGINDRVDARRVAAVRKAAQHHVPGVFDGRETIEWVGMRPLTVDGLPVIGRLPSTDNVFVATGHQMLGITLGPSTGRALADVMTDGRSDIDLAPFDPARFSRS
jgi:D-amino-acid dehydrogenase